MRKFFLYLIFLFNFVSTLTEAQTLVRLPGKARDIHINRYGSMSIIGVTSQNNNADIFTWERKNWIKKFTGKGIKVVMDGANRPWILNHQGEVWQFVGSKGWIKHDITATDLDIGHNNNTFIVGPEYNYQDENNKQQRGNVYQRLGANFEQINAGGIASKVRVDKDGNPWILTSSGSIRFKNNQDKWELIQTALRDFDVNSKEQLFGIEKAGLDGPNSGDGALVKYTGRTFQKVGGYGQRLSLSHDNIPYVVNSLYEIWGGSFTSLSLEDFGYKTMFANGQSAEGDRPVLVIPTRYWDTNFFEGNVNNRIKQLFFKSDTSSMNIQDYFKEMSYGKLNLIPAPSFNAILRHPRTMHCAHRSKSKDECKNPPSGRMEQAFDELLQLEAVKNYDFSIFDKNNDGKITDDELILVFYQAVRDPYRTGGINRGFVKGGCANTSKIKKVKLCTRMVLVAEQTGIATIAHEISHSLGTEDIYGGLSRLNYAHSLMGGTVSANYNQHEFYHLDPWHKMRLGWIRPEIYPISVASSSLAPEEFTLDLMNHSKEGMNKEPKTILLYDPNKGSNEGFLLEYRAPTRGSYDQNTPGSGVRVWYFKNRKAFFLENRPSFIIPGKDKVLDSEIFKDSDDQIFPFDSASAISWGDDQILQSRKKNKTDDQTVEDKALFTLNYNPLQNIPLIGQGETWTDRNTPVEFFWVDEIEQENKKAFYLKVMETPATNKKTIKIEVY